MPVAVDGPGRPDADPGEDELVLAAQEALSPHPVGGPALGGIAVQRSHLDRARSSARQCPFGVGDRDDDGLGQKIGRNGGARDDARPFMQADACHTAGTAPLGTHSGRLEAQQPGVGAHQREDVGVRSGRGEDDTVAVGQ